MKSVYKYVVKKDDYYEPLINYGIHTGVKPVKVKYRLNCLFITEFDKKNNRRGFYFYKTKYMSNRSWEAVLRYKGHEEQIVCLLCEIPANADFIESDSLEEMQKHAYIISNRFIPIKEINE